MNDLNDQNDLDNQMISLDTPNQQMDLDLKININDEMDKTNTNQTSNLTSMIISEDTQRKIAEKAVDNIAKEAEKTYLDKLLCFLNYFKQYFKITTKDIQNRIISSLKPINNSFYEEAINKPDLYGPFWIYTTLIFSIAAGGSLSKYFNDISTENFFQKFVPIAGSLIYIIGFGLPLLLYFGTRIFGEKIPYFSIVCIYGYSFTCFIPVMLICSCGVGFIQWIFLLYGSINSTMFVVINFWKELQKYEQKKKFGLLGLIIVVQFVLLLVLKLYFFDNFSTSDSTKNNPKNPTQ
jgi:hypothetical protein